MTFHLLRGFKVGTNDDALHPHSAINFTNRPNNILKNRWIGRNCPDINGINPLKLMFLG